MKLIQNGSIGVRRAGRDIPIEQVVYPGESDLPAVVQPLLEYRLDMMALISADSSDETVVIFCERV